MRWHRHIESRPSILSHDRLTTLFQHLSLPGYCDTKTVNPSVQKLIDIWHQLHALANISLQSNDSQNVTLYLLERLPSSTQAPLSLVEKSCFHGDRYTGLSLLCCDAV